MKSHILHSDFEDDSSADKLHKIERDQYIFSGNVDESGLRYYNPFSTFRIDYRNIPNIPSVLCVLVENDPIDNHPIIIHNLHITIG